MRYFKGVTLGLVLYWSLKLWEHRHIDHMNLDVCQLLKIYSKEKEGKCLASNKHSLALATFDVSTI